MLILFYCMTTCAVTLAATFAFWRHAEACDIDTSDETDIAVVGLASIVIGLLWPITLLFILSATALGILRKVFKR